MKMFFTSDTHFFHKRIIELCGRPFQNEFEMNSTLIQNWNSVVKPEDEVFHLGDFSFTKNQDIPSVFNSLNGGKHLIVGNHDPESTIELPWQSINKYKEMTWKDKNLVLFHYPISEWNGQFKGSIHLHGHIHTTYDTVNHKHKPIKGRWDVGVDNTKSNSPNEFRPHTLEEILEKINNAE